MSEKEAAMTQTKETGETGETGEMHALRVVDLPSWTKGIMRLPLGSKAVGLTVNRMKNLAAICLMSESPRLVTFDFQVARIGEQIDLNKMRSVGYRQMDYEVLSLFISKDPVLDPNDDVMAGF